MLPNNANEFIKELKKSAAECEQAFSIKANQFELSLLLNKVKQQRDMAIQYRVVCEEAQQKSDPKVPFESYIEAFQNYVDILERLTAPRSTIKNRM